MKRKAVGLLVRPATQPSIAWQFTGQPYHEWPKFAQDCCTLRKDDDGQLVLVHSRRSGKQWVYLDEWLVKDLDGDVCWYTDREVKRDFAGASER